MSDFHLAEKRVLTFLNTQQTFINLVKMIAFTTCPRKNSIISETVGLCTQETYNKIRKINDFIIHLQITLSTKTKNAAHTPENLISTRVIKAVFITRRKNHSIDTPNC